MARTRKTKSNASGFRNAGSAVGRKLKVVKGVGSDLAEGVQYFGRGLKFFGSQIVEFFQGVKEGIRG